jgi:hypothetical protein
MGCVATPKNIWPPAPASYMPCYLDVCGCSSSDDLEGLLRLTISEPAGAAGPDSTKAAYAPAAAAGLGREFPSSNSRARRRRQRGLTFEALLDDLVVLSFLVGDCDSIGGGGRGCCK